MSSDVDVYQTYQTLGMIRKRI